MTNPSAEPAAPGTQPELEAGEPAAEASGRGPNAAKGADDGGEDADAAPASPVPPDVGDQPAAAANNASAGSPPAGASAESGLLTTTNFGIAAIVLLTALLVYLLVIGRRGGAAARRRRRQDAQEMQPSPEADPIRDLVLPRLARIEERLERLTMLASAPGRAPQPAQPARPAEPGPPPRENADAVVDELRRRYLELIGGMKSRDRFAAFFSSRGAYKSFTVTPDGAALQESDDSDHHLSGIEVAGSYVLFPDFDFVTNFAIGLNAERSMPPEFRAAFNFEVNDTNNLVVEEPAHARSIGGGRYEIFRPGKISGLVH